LDGVDLREYDLEDLWRETGVIFQDFMRYDMTAAENIAIGKLKSARTLPGAFGGTESLAEQVIRKTSEEL